MSLFWLAVFLTALVATAIVWISTGFFVRRWQRLQVDRSSSPAKKTSLYRSFGTGMPGLFLLLPLASLSFYGFFGHWEDVQMQQKIFSDRTQDDSAEESLQIIAYLESRLQASPSDAPIWYQLGIEHLRLSDSERAMNAFEQASSLGRQLNPKLPWLEGLSVVMEALKKRQTQQEASASEEGLLDPSPVQ